jgi:hypothetical protein
MKAMYVARKLKGATPIDPRSAVCAMAELLGRIVERALLRPA